MMRAPSGPADKSGEGERLGRGDGKIEKAKVNKEHIKKKTSTSNTYTYKLKVYTYTYELKSLWI